MASFSATGESKNQISASAGTAPEKQVMQEQQQEQLPSKPALALFADLQHKNFALNHVDEKDIHVVKMFGEPMDEVIPAEIKRGLGAVYLGPLSAATCQAEALSARNIGTVLTVGKPEHLVVPEFDGVRYHRIAINDEAEEPIALHFSHAQEVIHGGRAGGKSVLVHCNAGVSRSPTCVAAYIMRQAQIADSEEVIAAIKAKRGAVNPNLGFREQLRAYGANSPMPAPLK